MYLYIYSIGLPVKFDIKKTIEELLQGARITDPLMYKHTLPIEKILVIFNGCFWNSILLFLQIEFIREKLFQIYPHFLRSTSFIQRFQFRRNGDQYFVIFSF